MSGLATNSLIVPDRSGQSYLQRRLPGETIHPDDDFFSSYSGYTELVVTGTTTWAKSRMGLTATFANQSGSDLSATLKAMTTGSPPVTIEAMMLGSITLANNPGYGICFSDGVIDSSNAVVLGGLANFGHIATSGTFTAMGAGTITAGEYRFGMGSYPLMWRLIWRATNSWAWAVSPDYGTTWTDYSNVASSVTMAPTHIGFWVTGWTTSASHIATFPYLRVYDADLSV